MPHPAPHCQQTGTEPAVQLLAQVEQDASYTGQYVTIVVVTLIVIVLLLSALWLGWRNRKQRQQHVAAPAPVPAGLLDQQPLALDEGMYVATVQGRDWLDRIAVHQLGIRTDAQMEVHSQGVVILRNGADNLFVRAGQITDVRLESGINGKFVEKEGLIVFSWMLGHQEVSTGFRTKTAAGKRPLYNALSGLIPEAGPATQRAATAKPNQTSTDDDSGRE